MLEVLLILICAYSIVRLLLADMKQDNVLSIELMAALHHFLYAIGAFEVPVFNAVEYPDIIFMVVPVSLAGFRRLSSLVQKRHGR